MSSFFEKAKEASSGIVNKSKLATELRDKYSDQIVSALIKVANEAAKHYIFDDDQYRKYVVDPLWVMIPSPVQLIGRERLGWDALIFNIRDQIFMVEDDKIKIRPNAKEKITARFKLMLEHHPTNT